jgi:hypothetical protein
VAPNKGVGNTILTGGQTDPILESSVNTMTPEELLLKAADDIAQQGHHKETFYKNCPYKGPACAYGAMFRAAGMSKRMMDGTLREPVRSAAVKLAEQIKAANPLFALSGGDEWDVVTSFNDHDNTTGEDVILAMKEAAHRG